MPLHEKRFDPKGKLVVAKADGLRFAGRTYNQGEQIDDPTLTMRKARQLYFQNKLCYDYELADKAADREEAARSLALAKEKIAAERAAREEQDRAEAEASRVRQEQAEEQRKADLARALEQADLAAGRVPAASVVEPEAPVIEPEIVVTPDTAPAAEMVLSPEDSVALVEAVINPSEPAPALEAAARRRRRVEAPSTDAAPQE